MLSKKVFKSESCPNLCTLPAVTNSERFSSHFAAVAAGIAGGLYAHHKQFLSPTGFDFLKSIDIVVMVILGGMGRTAGVVVAAVVLTLLPEMLRRFSDYRMIVYSLLIIVLMIARPQGLFHFVGPKKAKA